MVIGLGIVGLFTRNDECKEARANDRPRLSISG
jgi:hypothetical protein